MRDSIFFIRVLLLVLVLTLTMQTVFSQRQPVVTALPLFGDSIKVGKTLTVEDTVYLDGELQPRIAQTRSVDNIVALYIDEYSTSMLPDTFHVTLRLQLNYAGTGGSGSRYDTLRISYSKAHPCTAKALKVLKDYYSLQAEILEVTITAADAEVVLPFLILENMLSVERFFTTTCAAITSISGSDSAVIPAGEFSVSWPATEFASGYDLEWTYVDSSALE